MNINTLNTALSKSGILASLLLATALNMPLTRAQAFPAESIDANGYLPPNQAAQVTTEFLSRNIENAFELALNSPGDSLTMEIEGNVEFPVPIPYVPPGIFNGGVQVALRPEITVTHENANTYSEVSLELARGLSFGTSIPDMPAGTDASVKGGLSVSTSEIFRFNSPTEAARGIMDLILLHGLWQEMNKLEAIGIEITDVSDFTLAVRSYFADLAGVDFTLNRDDAMRALEAARISLQLSETGVQLASRSLEGAYTTLNAASTAYAAAQRILVRAQRRTSSARARLNACRWYCFSQKASLIVANAALTAARINASKTQSALGAATMALSVARSKLDQATDKLDQASQVVAQAQRQLALLPEDASIDPLEIVLSRIVDGVEFLNRSQQGIEMAFSKNLAVEAKASCVASIGGNMARTLRIKTNEIDKTIAIAISSGTDTSAQANLPPSIIASGVQIQMGRNVEYELVFALDDHTQHYALQDQGTLKLGAGVQGIAFNGDKFCSSVFNYDANVMAGVAVTPAFAFKPGQEMMEFGSNLDGVIDLRPVIEAVQGFPVINPGALLEAAVATMEGFDVNQLLAAIAQVNLPLTVDFKRIAGLRAGVNGGSDKVLKGGLKLSAVWSDHGETLDLSDITVADFADRVLDGGEGLVDTAATVSTLAQEAFQEVDAMF